MIHVVPAAQCEAAKSLEREGHESSSSSKYYRCLRCPLYEMWDERRLREIDFKRHFQQKYVYPFLLEIDLEDGFHHRHGKDSPGENDVLREAEFEIRNGVLLIDDTVPGMKEDKYSRRLVEIGHALWFSLNPSE